MIGKISSLLLSGAAAAATAALSLSCAPQANAQPYYDDPGYQPAPAAGDYSYDTAAEVGGVVVTPDYRGDRSVNGIPTQRVYASRVVPIDDLDLSTRWGVEELHARVAHAASSACDQLNNMWPQGLYPIDSSDGDCRARAIRHAMADAPISYPAYAYDYPNGY
ncbi:MAG TPA: UrcA family protein [Caulobacteraceae bacterium]|nr:UrcA family protein [Caulobacteraceae bacterium]